MNEESDILYYVGEIPIRKVNKLRLTLNEQEYKRLAIVANETDIPLSAIIAILCQPCPVCKTDTITISIPKNILSTNKANNGRSITNRLRNDE